MGERRKEALRVDFDWRIKLQFHGASVSSDAGLFPFRDLDEVCGLTESSAAELFDFRTGTNIRHSMVALLRQSVYGRLAGYEDVNDAERLSMDPVTVPSPHHQLLACRRIEPSHRPGTQHSRTGSP